MEHKMMNTARNVAIGAAIGTAVAAAGAAYLNENRQQAKKAVKKMKEGQKIITKAGESFIREINT
ncbi:MAG: hypothetical protein RR846_09345 [Oscillospiraceae bacterium]